GSDVCSSDLERAPFQVWFSQCNRLPYAVALGKPGWLGKAGSLGPCPGPRKECRRQYGDDVSVRLLITGVFYRPAVLHSTNHQHIYKHDKDRFRSLFRRKTRFAKSADRDQKVLLT